jgi:hypothetical protein
MTDPLPVPPAPIFFLCDCAACARRFAVLTEPLTQCQLWYDRRYYPNNPEAKVSGDGYHCPWCGARLSGTPGVLIGRHDWMALAGRSEMAGLN